MDAFAVCLYLRDFLFSRDNAAKEAKGRIEKYDCRIKNE